MKKQYLLLSAFVLLVQFAQAQFTLDGEFRPRAEMRNGYGSLIPEDTDAGFAISTRLRLNAGYTTDSYKFYMSLQDVMTWGENRQILPVDANNSFAVFQAWAELKLAPGFSTKLGRQVLSYDDQRILGGLGWAQQARNHDAALFRYKSEDQIKIDIALAFNQDGNNVSGFSSTGTAYNTSAFFTYKAMQMLHFNKKWKNLGLSLLAMNNTFQNVTLATVDLVADADEPTNLQTFGTHITYKSGAFNLAANAYAQFGEVLFTNAAETAGAVRDMEGGYLASLDLGYKVSDKVTLGLGGEIITGNGADDPTTATTAFFPLYGTNHKFNGWMDYFYVGNHANSVGLIDIHAVAKIKTGKKSGLMIKALNFMSEQDVTLTDGSTETQLGTEIDLVFTQKFKGYALKLGYSQMFASEGMEALKGVPTAKNGQNWAWAMLIIKPKFFAGAKKAPKKM